MLRTYIFQPACSYASWPRRESVVAHHRVSRTFTRRYTFIPKAIDMVQYRRYRLHRTKRHNVSPQGAAVQPPANDAELATLLLDVECGTRIGRDAPHQTSRHRARANVA